MSKLKAIGVSVAAIVILILAQLLAEVVASIPSALGVPGWLCNALAGILYLVIAYFLLRGFLEKVLKVKKEDFGLSKFDPSFKWILIGTILPLAVTAFYLLVMPGKVVSSGMDSVDTASALAAGIFFTAIAAGFVEEMVFRGVIFHALEEAFNLPVAVIAPSVLFGIVHILGMEFTVGSCILVVLAGTAVGVMFSLITIESGSVWNNGIVHVLWNFVIIGGVLTIGEKVDEYAITSYVLESKSFPITGGEFGIESSAIAFAAYVVVSVIACMMIKKKK